MNTLIFVSILSLGFAQQESQAGKFPSKEQLTLEYFTPEHATARDLTQVANQLYGERLSTVSGAGQAELVSHFIALGSTIVIQDTPERIGRITETLRQMDKAQSGQSSRPPIERMEYHARHASVKSIGMALNSFNSIEYWPIGEKRMLILKGTEQDLASARAMIEQLDVPVPQVTITCHLIRGTDSADSQGRLPRELTENLARILPMPGFEMLSVNAVQSTISETGIELVSHAREDIFYTCRLVPSAYDAQAERVSFSECSFSLSVAGREHQLRTSLALKRGEYAVLGAFGDEPVFVVLRIVPSRN